MTQTILTFIIIAAAVGLAVYKIYKFFTRKDNPCDGCKGCERKEDKK